MSVRSVAIVRVIAALVALVGAGTAVHAQQFPALIQVSSDVAAREPQFVSRRAVLQQERAWLHGAVMRLNSDCRAINVHDSARLSSCNRRKGDLAAALARHRTACDAFNNALASAEMVSLARRLNWDVGRQQELRAALAALKGDGDPNADSGQIRNAWQDILSRRRDPVFIDLARQGEGPGFPASAGQQGAHTDCAVFALANAADLPYGVVGTRAVKLVKQASWRSAAQRASAQQAIEHGGLVGGEVMMLAKMFGDAAVVQSAKFAETLRAGRRIMINVVPEDGNVGDGHEVVLSRTFAHGGGTWYEMIDSHQGPIQRLYLSAQELDIILQERGVAFSPTRGGTPQILRNDSMGAAR